VISNASDSRELSARGHAFDVLGAIVLCLEVKGILFAWSKIEDYLEKRPPCPFFYIIQMVLEDLCFRPKIGDYVEESVPEDCFLEDKLLARYAKILDIVNRESTRSCCFTKAYSHYYIGW
jgi:hypothetical protein